MQTCHLCWSSDSVHFGETARVQCQQPKGSSGLQRAGLVEKEMATHSSILAWKSPWTEEPGGLQSMGLHDWACVHEGGGWWVGSNKLVELKNKNKNRLLDGITDSMDMSLNKPQEIVKDREARCATVNGVIMNRTWLSDWVITSLVIHMQKETILRRTFSILQISKIQKLDHTLCYWDIR